ncbi:MAG: hypothetical protein JXB15_02590 [Anaerolineales bacterium]|nr:hypothetical protein [Anaerolineales bacterium]
MPAKKYQKPRKLFTWFGLILVLLSSACGGGEAVTTEPAQVVAPVVVVTEVVIQVVATSPPPTATPQPTPTPYPTAPAAWDPISAPIYYPQVGCVASRLHILDVAFVASVSTPVRLYRSKDVFEDPGVRELALGELVTILDGPWCNMDWIIWKVEASDGEKYFVPEGNGEIYWLLPLNPFVPSATPNW